MNVGELINYQEWHFRDKSDYGEGPWFGEPDKCQWIDKDTGYDCLVIRNHMGALCGYVGVKETHSLFEKGYYGVNNDTELEVHGGLTFSSHCQEDNKEEGVCHITDSEDKVWWFGFDCAGCYDLIPQHTSLYKKWNIGFSRNEYETYRDLDYVKSQIKSLASQLKGLEAEA